MDLRFSGARAFGEALKAGDVAKLQSFANARGYAVPAASAGKLDLATFSAIEQLLDDMKACVAPAPPTPKDGLGLDEGQLNASLAGQTFFVSYSAQLDQKRALALKAGVGAHGLDSAELWFSQKEANRRYTAALRADFLERTFAAKFDGEGRSDLGRGFAQEWQYQVGFAVLAGMYSKSLELRGVQTGTDADGNPIFANLTNVPGYSYDTALLVAGARYGLGFQRTWRVVDSTDKKLDIGFNWHADIGAHLSYELYHPPGNERPLASSQSQLTFTDISYLVSMSELHARTTANFTLDGQFGGVHFAGLLHLDSRIGLDDPTLGFTHNHNLAVAVDLGFLNDRIALHMGVNVPIYPSTLAPALANPVGTVGVTLQPNDAFSLGGNAAFNLQDGRLLMAGAEVSYTPERLFGLDTQRAVFIKGTYTASAGGEQTVLFNVGINFGGGASPALPSSEVDGAYQNPVTEPLGGTSERTPRATDDSTSFTTKQCSPALLYGVRGALEQLRAEAKAARDAGDQGLLEKKTEQAMALLKTPDMVAAACDGQGNGIANYQYHLDEPSKFTPADFFAKGYGVCAEFHTFAAAALRENGYQAYPIEFFAPGRSHVVCAFCDESGRWQILEYAQIHFTNGASAEEALRRFEPGVMKYKIFEPTGGRARVVEQGTSPLVSSLQDFFDRSWI
jgi:hypothetical protein